MLILDAVGLQIRRSGSLTLRLVLDRTDFFLIIVNSVTSCEHFL